MTIKGDQIEIDALKPDEPTVLEPGQKPKRDRGRALHKVRRQMTGNPAKNALALNAIDEEIASLER